MLKAVLDFFGFSRLPFSKGLSPKEAFPTSSHTEALARLQYGIGSEDFLLLTGPVGVGISESAAPCQVFCYYASISELSQFSGYR